MKKLLSGILVILALFSLTACNDEKEIENNMENNVIEISGDIYENSNSGEVNDEQKPDLVSGENDEEYRIIDVIQLNGKDVEIGRSFENVVDNWEGESIDVRYTAELKLYIDGKEVTSQDISFFENSNACIEKSSIGKIKDNNGKEYLAIVITTYSYDFENRTLFVLDDENNILMNYVVDYTGISYFKDGVQLKYEINEDNIIMYEAYDEEDILNKCRLKIVDGMLSEEIIESYKISDLEVVSNN